MRVLIIGAGFAGLSAAKTLIAQSDCEVVVLEASSCVGGRARTGVLPSNTLVELGATWFHGVRDNPMYDMAVWQGVVKDVRCDPEAQKHDIDWQLHFARPLESQLLTGDLNAIAMEAVGRYTDAAEECVNDAQLGDGSVGDVLRRTFDEAVVAEGLQGEQLQVFADAWHFREKLQRTFDGFFSTDDVSLAFPREYETLEGPNMPVPGGYQALAEILAQGLEIHFNHRVQRVAYGPTGVSVTCDNGRIFEAHCCIVACSVGVLQAQHRQLFDPPLPPWKVDGLQAIRIGVADKLFVEFEIEPARARAAAAWLTSHANLATSPPQQQQQDTPPPAVATPQLSTLPHLPPQLQRLSLDSAGAAASSSSVALPPDVLAALPPQATGGMPEPFNLGRRPEALLGPNYTPEPHAAALAAAGYTLPQQLQQQEACGSGATVQRAHQALTEDSASSGTTTVVAAAATIAALAVHHPAAPLGAGTANNSHHSAPSPSPPGSMLALPLATASAAAAWPPLPPPVASLTAASADGRPSQPGGGRPGRRRKHRRTIHSYAFLWSVHTPELLGSMGHPALAPAPPDPRRHFVCADQLKPPPPLPAGRAVPAWVQGLHSIRYCPGPEWIEPSLLQGEVMSVPPAGGPGEQSPAASGGSGGAAGGPSRAVGKRTAQQALAAAARAVNLMDGGATHVSGVLWITGAAALAMERANEEELVAGVSALFSLFPQVPVPPGAILPPKVLRTTWGTDPLFRGSYSYVNVSEETGDAVDALAEPLCNDQGMPIVLFAGEATYRPYIGTVHGAFLSGCREAERLLDAMQALQHLQPPAPAPARSPQQQPVPLEEDEPSTSASAVSVARAAGGGAGGAAGTAANMPMDLAPPDRGPGLAPLHTH